MNADDGLDSPNLLKVENRQTAGHPAHKQFHKLADIFPLLDGAEFSELVADVKSLGLREPIVLYEGKILDGRNRYRACLEAGVEPYFSSYQGNDPAGFIMSANIHRRHLTPEKKRELIANLLKAKPELSDRQISKMAKVDNKTVAPVRARMEATEEIPQLAKTIGADGKARVRKASIKPRVNKIKAKAAQSARDALAAAALAWRDATAADQTRFVSNVGLSTLFKAAPTQQRDSVLRKYTVVAT
jgi:ParB-like chromosome segregation protein Spo0J